MPYVIIINMDEVDINAPSEKLENVTAENKAVFEKALKEADAKKEPEKKPFAISDEHESHIRGVRTYSSDLAEAIKDGKGSIIKIAIAENERKQQERREFEDAPKKNALFAVGSILVILIALGLFYGIYWYKQTKTIAPVVVVEPRPETIIKSEYDTLLNVFGKTRTQIIPNIRSIVLKPDMRPGTIKEIAVIQKGEGKDAEVERIPASKFLQMLDVHASSDFLRSLNAEFMLGMYLYDKTNLFIALTGQSHDYLLSGMLKWEPFLFEDLGPLFGIDIYGEGAEYRNTPLKDTFVENHDVRAVLDKNNNPLIFYTFINPETIFIANDSKTLTEAVLKMRVK